MKQSRSREFYGRRNSRPANIPPQAPCMYILRLGPDSILKVKVANNGT